MIDQRDYVGSTKSGSEEIRAYIGRSRCRKKFKGIKGSKKNIQHISDVIRRTIRRSTKQGTPRLAQRVSQSQERLGQSDLGRMLVFALDQIVDVTYRIKRFGVGRLDVGRRRKSRISRSAGLHIARDVSHATQNLVAGTERDRMEREVFPTRSRQINGGKRKRRSPTLAEPQPDKAIASFGH